MLRRGLGPVLLKERLEKKNDDKGQCEDQNEAALHSGFLLRIVEFSQIKSSLFVCAAHYSLLAIRLSPFARSGWYPDPAKPEKGSENRSHA